MISTTILVSPSLMLMISISLPIPLLQVLITFSYWSLNCVCAFLDTHDIQSITIINNGSSNGTVCIQCNYITGADSTRYIVSLFNSIHISNEYGCEEVITGFYVYEINVNNDGTIVIVEDLNYDSFDTYHSCINFNGCSVVLKVTFVIMLNYVIYLRLLQGIIAFLKPNYIKENHSYHSLISSKITSFNLYYLTTVISNDGSDVLVYMILAPVLAVIAAIILVKKNYSYHSLISSKITGFKIIIYII